MLGEVAERALGPVQSVLAAATVQTLPPQLQFEARIETADADWPRKQADAFGQWQASIDEDLGKNLPSIVRLQRNLSVRAEAQHLIGSATVDKETLRDLGGVLSELLQLVFSDLGVEPGASTGAASGPEMILPDDEVPAYEKELSHTDPAALRYGVGFVVQGRDDDRPVRFARKGVSAPARR